MAFYLQRHLICASRAASLSVVRWSQEVPHQRSRGARMVMILLVDDLADSCRALVRLLKLSGYQAECVSSGDQALAVMKAIKPQLVVLDEMMPGKSGIDVLRELKSRPELADVPVLFY